MKKGKTLHYINIKLFTTEDMNNRENSFRRLFFYNFVRTGRMKKCQSKGQHTSRQKKKKNILSKSRSWFKFS